VLTLVALRGLSRWVLGARDLQRRRAKFADAWVASLMGSNRGPTLQLGI
jgi:hypothetical protein